MSNGQEGSGGICGVLGAGGQGGLRISPVGGRQGGVHVVVPAPVESQTEPKVGLVPSKYRLQTCLKTLLESVQFFNTTLR